MGHGCRRGRLRCVVSVHKMGAGFEQGSVFHLQGDLVDRDRLSQCADLLMTTSPNTMVYAAIDVVPGDFVSITPYVVTLLVLAFASQRLRMPAADGQIYRKGSAG